MNQNAKKVLIVGGGIAGGSLSLRGPAAPGGD